MNLQHTPSVDSEVEFWPRSALRCASPASRGSLVAGSQRLRVAPMSACRIGLAIPAWRSARLIGETLHSALSQSGVDVTVMIGVDGADSDTAAACAPFLHDARVHLIVRPTRLGWVKNSAATLADAVATGVDYAAILPHDDILEPGYCAALAAGHRARPGAAVVYSDIVAFGDHRKVLRQESVCGP